MDLQKFRKTKKGVCYELLFGFRARNRVRGDAGNDPVERLVELEGWKDIARDLRICADAGLCADCGQETKWACDWDLMRKAADLIEAMAKEMGLKK